MITTTKGRAYFRCVVAALLLLLAASPLFARAVDPKLKRAVRKANADWAAAVKTGDAAAIAAPYAEDALFVLADGTCIRGRAEIEKLYRVGFERRGVAAAAKIDSKTLIVDGDLAYESGYGEVRRAKDGSTAGGRYLTIWQRTADGDWKIIRNLVF